MSVKVIADIKGSDIGSNVYWTKREIHCTEEYARSIGAKIVAREDGKQFVPSVVEFIAKKKSKD